MKRINQKNKNPVFIDFIDILAKLLGTPLLITSAYNLRL